MCAKSASKDIYGVCDVCIERTHDSNTLAIDVLQPDIGIHINIVHRTPAARRAV